MAYEKVGRGVNLEWHSQGVKGKWRKCGGLGNAPMNTIMPRWVVCWCEE